MRPTAGKLNLKVYVESYASWAPYFFLFEIGMYSNGSENGQIRIGEVGPRRAVRTNAATIGNSVNLEIFRFNLHVQTSHGTAAIEITVKLPLNQNQ